MNNVIVYAPALSSADHLIIFHALGAKTEPMSLENIPLFSTCRVGRTASDVELARASEIIGTLPPSYIAFAKTYGAGLTNGLLLIAMPFDNKVGSIVGEAADHSKRLQTLIADYIEDGGMVGDIDCLEPYDSESEIVADRYRDLLIFAKSENGELFGWLATSEGHQFFCIDRACFSVRYCGCDLFQLIKALQSDAVKTMMGEGYQSLPAVFEGFD